MLQGSQDCAFKGKKPSAQQNSDKACVLLCEFALVIKAVKMGNDAVDPKNDLEDFLASALKADKDKLSLWKE